MTQPRVFTWLMERPGRWWACSLLVLSLGLGWTWASRVPPAEAQAGQIASPRAGFPAPAFSLETLDGTPAALADYRGQVVIVNVWASWCSPCRAEMPALQQVQQQNRERGLVVLAVNSTVQDGETAARAFVSELGLTFPVLLDREGEVTHRYLVRALPSTFFVDRQGIIRSVIIGGPMSPATLQSQAEQLLGGD